MAVSPNSNAIITPEGEIDHDRWRPAVHWSFQERWVWSRLIQRKPADFDVKCGAKILPFEDQVIYRDSTDCPRKLTAEFILDIITNVEYSSRLPQKGIRIAGAWFQEFLDLSDIRLDKPLCLERSRFDEGFALQRANVDGFISLSGSWIRSASGQVDSHNREVSVALNMSQLKAGSNVFLRNMNVEGDVFLIGARIDRTLQLVDSTFKGTCDLGGIETGESLLLRGQNTTFKKKLLLIEAKIRGSVEAGGADFNDVLDMERLEVGRSVHLRYGVSVEKSPSFKSRVSLVGAKIGSNLDLSGGRFAKLVDLTGAKIDGELRLAMPHHGRAIWGENARLIARNVSVSSIHDRCDENDDREPFAWPASGSLELDGLTYQRLGGWHEKEDSPCNLVVRSSSWYISWLGRNSGLSPQPYQQLEGFLRGVGADKEANRVLFAGREQERRAAGGLRWIGLSLLKHIIGYGVGAGYFRALKWAATLVIAGTICVSYGRSDGSVFSASAGAECSEFIIEVDYDKPCYDSKPRLPNPLDSILGEVGFSLNQLLPILNLDKSYEEIRLVGGVRLYFFLHKIAGWVLGSFLIAGLAGLTQRR